MFKDLRYTQGEVDREPTSIPLSLVTENTPNAICQRQNLLDNTLRPSSIDEDCYNRVSTKIFVLSIETILINHMKQRILFSN